MTPDVRIRVASLPAFLATKFEALASRGGDDHIADADFEDIIVLLGTRGDALEQIERAPTEIREFLNSWSRELLESRGVEDSISGCFDADGLSQAAVPRVLALLRTLAGGS